MEEDKAGSLNASAASGVAQSSICPKGWQLPADDAVGVSKSFANLLSGNAGNISDGSTGLGGYGIETVLLSKTLSGSNIDSIVQNAPLSFIRSGYYRWSTGYLVDRRSYGGYWSSRVYSAQGARYLAFNSTYVYPRNSTYKGYGFAVRCVARD